MDVSDETQRALKDAAAVVAARRETADAKRQECLDAVADGIPGRVDALAKSTAQSQPDVTKTLGSTGVRALRGELAAEAAELAQFVRTGSAKISWPRRESEWSKVEARKIHSALFKFMYGAPVNRIGAVFARHGYDVRRSTRDGSQGLVLPQSLYDEDSFHAVAEALNDLGAAEIAYEKAKAEDDRDIVDSLWEE